MREDGLSLNQEQVTQHFLETMNQLQVAFAAKNDRERDQHLDGVIQFFPLYRDKIKSIKQVLAQSRELQTKQEGKRIYENTQLFLLQSKVQNHAVRRLLSDLFLLRYARQNSDPKGIGKPAEVFKKLLADAHIDSNNIARLTAPELFKNILLNPVAENSLPQEETKIQKIVRSKNKEV